MTEKLQKAMYSGKLPIGNIELDAYVLEDGTRILSQSAIYDALGSVRKGNYTRTELPSFISADNLKPYINQDFLSCTKLINFTDGKQVKSGYNGILLPRLCKVYLDAWHDNVLKPGQIGRAKQAGVLLSALGDVGITALIDEATGYQQDRKSDALRVLLDAYLADGIKKWLKEFPDDFFYELDRLYGNEHLKSNQRPRYYGGFINKYVYEPIENGKINPELQKRYVADHKNNRKHQHFTDLGSNQLRIQIGKVLGAMQIAPNLKWFKQKQERLGQLSLFPDME